MRIKARLLAFALPLFAAACVSPEQPVAAPAPLPVVIRTPTIAPPAPIADWTLRPATPGDWSYATTAQGSAARFGVGTGAPALTIACDNVARRITVSKPGAAGPARLTLRSTTRAGAYQLTPDAAGLTATLPATDPVLDSVAYTRGRFLVQSDGAPDMVLPAWAEVSRVVEDCRR